MIDQLIVKQKVEVAEAIGKKLYLNTDDNIHE